MGSTEWVGTDAVTGKFTFIDGSERYATKRTKFEHDKPVIEIAEVPNSDTIRFAMEGELFQGIVSALRVLVREAKMRFDPDGLRIRIVDPTRVAMEDIFVPREAFVEYKLGDRHLVISLDVDGMRDLRIKKSTGIINIEIAPKHKYKTERVEINGIEHDFVSIEYGSMSVKIAFNNLEKKISTLDNETVSTPKIPEMATAFYAVVPTRDIRAFIEQAAYVSDAVRFTLTRDAFKMRSTDENEEAKATIRKEMMRDIRIKANRISSAYPLKYVAKFFSAMLRSGDVKISFKDDYPVTMEFQEKYSMANVSIECLIAPRIERQCFLI